MFHRYEKFYSAPFLLPGRYVNKTTKIFFNPVDVIRYALSLLILQMGKYLCRSVCLLHFHPKTTEPIQMKFGTIVNNLRKDRLIFNAKKSCKGELVFISSQRNRGHS